jgi:hypothetical protein
MRLVDHIVGAALFAVALPTPVLAQQAGITYDCDTAADSFSELVLPAPQAAFVVSGRVQLNRIAKIGKYTPLTRLTVSASTPVPGQSPDDWAGFELSAFPTKSLGLKIKTDKPVLQFLTWDERAAGQKKPHDPLGPLDYADSLPFTLTYDGAVLVGKIGDQEQRMAIAVKNPLVRLVCSTGEFLYTNLRIERAG